ncbi:DDB1- and CUL4-associated factor 8-like [Anneissia japonica]|uniref:DDB1- and CUL4-associated factor 8-like n=1 Tax=Anneissia japonica TaxID=1529436 RepID=UPI001425B7A8|nr:DDB1- and CUL4-associated factor 8-like [Anneissia japonica]
MSASNCGDKMEPSSSDQQKAGDNHHHGNESLHDQEDCKTKEPEATQGQHVTTIHNLKENHEKKESPTPQEEDMVKNTLSSDIDEAFGNLESRLMDGMEEEDDRKEENSASFYKKRKLINSHQRENEEGREVDESDSDSVGERELDNVVEQHFGSDTSTDEEIEQQHDEKDEDMSDFEDEQKNKPQPSLIWRALPDLFNRERGLLRNPLNFCHRTIANVSMVQRFKQYTALDSHEGCVNTLHFNQSGNLLTSGSDDLKIILWDWAREKKLLQYNSGHRANVFQAKFMPFSRDSTIVSCARDGQVRVAEISSVGNYRDTRKLVGHKGAAHKLALEPASPVVFLSCGEDGQVFNIDLRQEKPNNHIDSYLHGVQALIYIYLQNCEQVTMYSNHRERDEERRREPEGIDSTMLMLLMQHLQRRARRQAREAGGEVDSDSDDTSSTDSDNSDTSGEFPSGGGVQCPTS